MMNSAKLPLNILHEDPDFVIVIKESGMLSVPGKGPDKADCVVSRLKALYPHCIEYPAVHRLDMDTSGIQLLALNKESLKSLSRQFEDRTVSKKYIAILDGALEGSSGTKMYSCRCFLPLGFFQMPGKAL